MSRFGWMLAALALLVPASCGRPSDDELRGVATPPTESPTTGASCASSCGQESPDQSCSCESSCATIGDCCADFFSQCLSADAGKADAGKADAGKADAGGGSGGAAADGGGSAGAPAGGAASGGAANQGPSCAGLCGGSAPGEECWCDDVCSSFGDCCTDFIAVCGAPSGNGCTSADCGTANPVFESGGACYCDPACVESGDCCTNVKAVCSP